MTTDRVMEPATAGGQTEATRITGGPRYRDVDDPMPRREWLVTNGLGGYASGSVAGVITRRYHGVLIASLPAPFGRIVMMSHLPEQVRLGGGRRIEIGGRESSVEADVLGTSYLTEFRLECGLPVWRYEVEGLTIEKR